MNERASLEVNGEQGFPVWFGALYSPAVILFATGYTPLSK